MPTTVMHNRNPATSMYLTHHQCRNFWVQGTDLSLGEDQNKKTLNFCTLGRKDHAGALEAFISSPQGVSTDKLNDQDTFGPGQQRWTCTH